MDEEEIFGDEGEYDSITVVTEEDLIKIHNQIKGEEVPEAKVVISYFSVIAARGLVEGVSQTKLDDIYNTLLDFYDSDLNASGKKMQLSAIKALFNCCSYKNERDIIVGKNFIERAVGLMKNMSVKSSVIYYTLLTLENICLDKIYHVRVAQSGIAEWIVPLLYSNDPKIRYHSCLVISSLCLEPESRSIVEKSSSSCLDEMELFLRTLINDDVRKFGEGMSYGSDDVNLYLEMISPSNPLAVRYTGAAALNEVSTESPSLILEERTLRSIFHLSSASDPFLYHFVINILKNSDPSIPIPLFRENPSNLPEDPHTWSNNDVVYWVSLQPFSIYINNFRESLINGRVLLQLDFDDLFSMGIGSRIHQKVILDSVQQLGGTKVSKSLDLPDRKSSQNDVFISYRRSNGSQLAHLIKISLKLKGFKVFLDVDSLGSGEFDTALVQNLKSSKNVVLILTEGSLDRCMKNFDDPYDFVRQEIAISLQARKNIIPITNQFSFPKSEDLPSDIQDIVRFNALEWNHAYSDAVIDKLISRLSK